MLLHAEIMHVETSLLYSVSLRVACILFLLLMYKCGLLRTAPLATQSLADSCVYYVLVLCTILKLPTVAT